MRNNYGGTCYFCSKYVERGAGHFERHGGKWRVIHAGCAIVQRVEKKNNG